jgi:hypothetical protein
MRLFEKIKPDILSEIESFCKRNNISLFSRIKSEEKLLNMKALLTEAHFGMYFEKIGEELKYNQKIGLNNQTPDYLFKFNGQDIIAEVCHINPAQNDIDAQFAEDAEYNKLNDEGLADYWIGGFHPITWKPEKLGGKNGSLAVKARKYGPLAELLCMPLILCVYLEFTSGLDSLDLYHSLYGHHVTYIGEFSFQGFSSNTEFHDLQHALYYTNLQMMKNVSGVLLRENNGAFTYYNNFSNQNRLSFASQNLLCDLQHPYR